MNPTADPLPVYADRGFLAGFFRRCRLPAADFHLFNKIGIFSSQMPVMIKSLIRDDSSWATACHKAERTS
jgi:hypothetical protein